MARNDTTRKGRDDVDPSRSTEDIDLDQAQEALLEEQVEAARQAAEARRKGNIVRTEAFAEPKDPPQEPEVPVQVPQHPTNPTPEY